MMKSKNTKGFTLVELIIVITILAILATIAFVSFQSYTKDARNSKRMSDLSTLAQAIEIKLANSVNVIDMVTGTGRVKNTTGDMLAGYTATGAANQGKYRASDAPNFNVIGAKSEDFRDPKDQSSYLIGATTLGGAYELATELYETDAGTGARISGNYKARNMSNSGAMASTGSTGVSGQFTYVLSGSNALGMFRYGDITNLGEIIGVSSDLTRLTISSGSVLNVNSAIFLSGSIAATGSGEIKSLIRNLSGY